MALDISIGHRVKWLADEQAAGNGTVVLCGMCKGSGFDPEDPTDSCTPCRGVGAILAMPDPGRLHNGSGSECWCKRKHTVAESLALNSVRRAEPVPQLPTAPERKRLRLAFGVTQDDLANSLGVTPRTVRRWENGMDPTGQALTEYASLLARWGERTERN
jgi:DNA-binding transcriptional regulator YiaG